MVLSDGERRVELEAVLLELHEDGDVDEVEGRHADEQEDQVEDELLDQDGAQEHFFWHVRLVVGEGVLHVLEERLDDELEVQLRLVVAVFFALTHAAVQTVFSLHLKDFSSLVHADRASSRLHLPRSHEVEVVGFDRRPDVDAVLLQRQAVLVHVALAQADGCFVRGCSAGSPDAVFVFERLREVSGVVVLVAFLVELVRGDLRDLVPLEVRDALLLHLALDEKLVHLALCVHRFVRCRDGVLDVAHLREDMLRSRSLSC